MEFDITYSSYQEYLMGPVLNEIICLDKFVFFFFDGEDGFSLEIKVGEPTMV